MIINDFHRQFISKNYLHLTPVEIGESLHIKENTIRRYMTINKIPMRRKNGTFYHPTGLKKKITRKEFFNVNQYENWLA